MRAIQLSHRFGPHLRRDRLVVARNEMVEHQRLHLGGSGDASDVLGERMTGLEVLKLRRDAMLKQV